jgi:hypothetical protein
MILGMSGFITRVFITKDLFLVPIIMIIIAFSVIYLLSYVFNSAITQKWLKKNLKKFFDPESILDLRIKNNKNVPTRTNPNNKTTGFSKRNFSSEGEGFGSKIQKVIRETGVEIATLAGVTEGTNLAVQAMDEIKKPTPNLKALPGTGPTGLAHEIHEPKLYRSQSTKYFHLAAETLGEAAKTDIVPSKPRFTTPHNIRVAGGLAITGTVVKGTYQIAEIFKETFIPSSDYAQNLERRHTEPSKLPGKPK